MAVEDAADFADEMTDWGSIFILRGVEFLADFSEPPADAFNARGSAPSLRAVVADVPELAVGDVVVHKDTRRAFTVVELDQVQKDPALPATAWRAKLNV